MIVPRDRRPASLRLTADACVIGTGAGGAAAAAALAEAGARVVVLEAGPYLTPRDLDQREDRMLRALFHAGGADGTDDGTVRILRGECVGGSTVHNLNVCQRAPDRVLDAWGKAFGLHDTAARVAAIYRELWRDLPVTPIPEQGVNRNNRVLQRGCRALGYAGARLAHNRRGCIGSGFCALGCSYDAKQNALKVFVPRAVRSGATVLADCPVERIEIEGGRARRALAPGVSVEAASFVVAAGAIGTPALLARSRAPDPHRHLGRHLHLHPGAAVAAVMDEPIEGWDGIPQSFECTEHLSEGVWILPAFAHPIAAASLLPGLGDAHDERMRRYPRLAVLSAVIHDRAEGEVRDRGGEPHVSWEPGERDCQALALGVRECAKLLRAAGARELILPLAPARAWTDRAVAAIRAGDVAPPRLPLVAVHPMGTARMAAGPKQGVTDGRGQHHQVDNLYVADASLIPGALHAPPQMTVYALGLHVGRTLAAKG